LNNPKQSATDSQNTLAQLKSAYRLTISPKQGRRGEQQKKLFFTQKQRPSSRKKKGIDL